MAEYIDREAAINAVFEAFADGRSAYIALETVPAADVRPVRRGTWIHESDELWIGGGKTKCSRCEFGYADGMYHEVDEFNYCPNCGARMVNDDV